MPRPTLPLDPGVMGFPDTSNMSRPTFPLGPGVMGFPDTSNRNATMSTRSRVYVINGDIFYSPNSSADVTGPLPAYHHRYIFQGFSLSVEDFNKPRWWSDAYGWLSFVPLRPSFAGIPFDRLNIFPPIVHGESGYHLRRDVLESWQRLENKMIYTALFMKIHGSRLFINKYAPLPSLRPPPPSDLGYELGYRRAHQARGQISLARDWFVMWMGYLSFLVAMTFNEERPTDSIPEWVKLLANEGFPQVWLSGVMASSICNFSSHIPRAGIFLDPLRKEKYSKQPPVDFFCAYHVPVWYPWTSHHATEARFDARIARLAPPPELLQAATSWITRSPEISSREMSTNPITPSNPSNTKKKPTPSWVEFFAARAKRHAERELTEDPLHRQIRLQRERQPAIKKAKVFVWVYNEDDPPQLVRQKVSQKFNADTIDGYGLRQRRYDAWENEWDLCEEFGDDDSDDDDGYDEPSTSTADIPGELPDDASVEPRDDAVDAYLERHSFDRTASPLLPDDHSDDERDKVNTDVVKLLACHFGFTPPLLDRHSGPHDSQKWRRYVRALGVNVVTSDSRLSSIEIAMLHFVSALSSGLRPEQHEWDLCDGNQQALVLNRPFPISRPALDLFVFSSPPSSSCDWVLGLTNPADALYASRTIGKEMVNIYGVARFLIERGIKFRTLVSLPSVSPSVSIRDTTRMIPIRLSGYQFASHDYAAYLHDRAAILAQPQGRAALLQGGIVWRLAKEDLGLDSALQGPSSAVTAHHTGYATDELDLGWALWDDELSDTEARLICGVYNCYTGMSESNGCRIPFLHRHSPLQGTALKLQ